MTERIFQIVPLQKQSFLQRLFKQRLNDNAVIALNNLLATKPILEVNTRDITAIEAEYQIDLNQQYGLNMQEFYAVYLGYCLQKKDITTDEQVTLAYLKTILKLNEVSVNELHTKLGRGVFEAIFENTISDGRLTQQKEDDLERLAQRIGIPDTVSKEISENARKAYISNYVGRIISDERYSPDEEKELFEIAKSLKVDLGFDTDLRWKLEKLKVYWQIENLPLPAISPGIILQKTETCHLQINNVDWHELRVVTQRVSYRGYSSSIKIAKGFYLRTGSYTPRSYKTEQMKLIDTGTLYLTNKRLIFAGRLKNSNIRLEKIIDFVPYSDGVEIRKDTGKSPLLTIQNNADVFCIMLGRLLNSN